MAFQKNGALIERIASTATSAGTLTLTNSSASYQRFTGTTTHTVVLPQANAASPSECPVGLKFVILNRSTGDVTVNYNGGSLAAVVSAGTQKTFRLTDTSTAAGTWDVSVESGAAAASLSSSEKLATLMALGTSLYGDSQAEATSIKVNPEEIGGNYFLTKATIPRNTASGSAFVLNGFYYLNGGWSSASFPGFADGNSYNLDSNYWLSVGNRNVTRLAAMSDSLGGFAYDSGGYLTSTTFSAALEQFSDSTRAWTSKTLMPSVLAAGGGCSTSSYFYTLMGSNGNATANYAYNASSNVWYTRQPSATGGGEMTMLPFDGASFNIAGLIITSTAQNFHVKYVEVLNAYLTQTSLLAAKSGASGGVVNGAGYTFGSGTTPQTTVDEFNPVAQVWLSRAPLSSARLNWSGHGTKGSSLSGFGLAAGGDTTSNNTGMTNLNQLWVNSSYVTIPFSKVSTGVPTSIFAAAAINGVVTSLPARLRTDGDNWKSFTANQDTVLKGSGAGVAEGSEIVANGTFNTDLSGWSSSNGGSSTNTWQSPGYALLSRSSGQQCFYQTLSTVAGKTYRLQFDVSSVSSGALYVEAQNGTVVAPGGATYIAQASDIYGGISANGTYYLVFTAQSANTIINFHMEVQAVCSCRLDNVSVKSVAISGVELISAKFQNYQLPFIFGGAPPSSSNTAAVYSYLNDTNAWSTRTSLSSARGGQFGIFSLEDKTHIAGGSDSSGTRVNTTIAYSELTGASVNKATISSSRNSMSAFRLNGLGYVVCGYTGSNSQIVESYNSSTDAWIAKANYTVATISLAAASGFGSGYGLGGNAGGVTASSYRYSDSLNTWASITSMSQASNSHCGVALNERIHTYAYYAGGSTVYSTAHYYTHQANAWTSMANMPSSALSAMPMSAENYLFSVNTDPGLGSTNPSNYRYTAVANVWATRTAPPTTAYGAHTSSSQTGSYRNYQLQIGLPTYLAAVGGYTWTTRASTLVGFQNAMGGLMDDKLAATGGSSYITPQIYNPFTDSWMYWTAYPENVNTGSNFTLQGRLYSGAGGTPYTYQSTNSYYYTSATSTWTATGSVPNYHCRNLANSGSALNGYGYFNGGTYFANNTTYFPYTDRYNPTTGTWSNVANLLKASNINYIGAFSLNGFMYESGGTDNNTGITNAVDRFNDSTNTWTATTNYPTNIHEHATFARDGRGFSAAGVTNNGAAYTNAAYNFNDASAVWSSIPNYPLSVQATVPNSMGYLAGGYSGSNVSNTYYLASAIKNVVLGAALRVSE